jgi:hypothetical protein
MAPVVPTPFTTAQLHATLSVVDYHHDLHIMVSSDTGNHADPLTPEIRLGYFQPVTSDARRGPVGVLTLDQAEGQHAATLTVTPRAQADRVAIDRAPTVAQLIAALGRIALRHPDAIMLVPVGHRLYAPLGPDIGHGYYHPTGDVIHRDGVWNHDPIGATPVYRLWPAEPIHTKHLASTPTPSDWLARLYQAHHWTDPYGRQRPIADLSLDDLVLALGWLIANAQHIARQVMGLPLGEAQQHTEDPAGAAPLLAPASMANPVLWIRATPLARALTLRTR